MLARLRVPRRGAEGGSDHWELCLAAGADRSSHLRIDLDSHMHMAPFQFNGLQSKLQKQSNTWRARRGLRAGLRKQDIYHAHDRCSRSDETAEPSEHQTGSVAIARRRHATAWMRTALPVASCAAARAGRRSWLRGGQARSRALAAAGNTASRLTLTPAINTP